MKEYPVEVKTCFEYGIAEISHGIIKEINGGYLFECEYFLLNLSSSDIDILNSGEALTVFGGGYINEVKIIKEV